MTARTVLFDLDGVLVDSQDAEVLALLEFAGTVHARVPAEGFAERVAGRRMSESVAIIGRYTDAPLPDDAVERVREIAERHLANRLRATPGMAAALREITAPAYVVSNSPLGMIEDRLRRTGLAGFFTGPHFSAYELGTWKPDPGLYRQAVRALGLDPETVVAVEDSEVGVRSAHDAGLRVHWYRPGRPEESRYSGRVRVFGDMRALPELLAARV
ncbi:HAD family phosphatase [Streptomyces sp. MC1]|uniref:HAD family hydrolase n=1 Tax=Streptomyces sp. MC1 TaxID=295105 RepID=UPI00069FE728|nr:MULTISPECIES: HAD family phosphatase [Streptomyces]MBG7702870.1 HAD family phosphatase [Streptomyces sp. MC1]